ncbi:hypothetical protein HanRHA438_Chr09g0393921 [Helianthus annuus]|uniref:Uncharacterized protein n=1 Tax=Helianthus annuus TaxID=4232 RepID=A0A251TU32_HELAN|nr:hypothetical protein HanHA300_Chr09g0313811 [Helianthus annuus]KAJ0541977.1 hypothetical protein HanHA89_Chr09g0334681 [Helianthus annuus]KAJ0707042.1 hypothetical protein HanLR1_Chr09g0314031 [Helianthus annuus]KAJ0711066.1 hypothetical protein HanOQP8_Chr09g0319641 [Helianthus annuus]KAJ0887706.1 hypothetical protein HanRHA438_Chr09g0393921 [Helianthus annuus]
MKSDPLYSDPIYSSKNILYLSRTIETLYITPSLSILSAFVLRISSATVAFIYSSD